jgi:hypothetical protein
MRTVRIISWYLNKPRQFASESVREHHELQSLRGMRAATLPRYARMKQVKALIAGTYLAGINSRRVRRALAALFKGAIGKDAVSRIWRKVLPAGQLSLFPEDIAKDCFRRRGAARRAARISRPKPCSTG